MRQRGEDVFFLTGTDEHGTAPAAGRRGGHHAAGVRRPQLGRVPRSWRVDLEATNDFFIRTTDAGTRRSCRASCETLRDNGHVYEGIYAGLYCDACEAFYRENELVDGKCPIHGTRAALAGGAQLVLPALRVRRAAARALRRAPRLRACRASRYNEARSFIEAGLDDVSLSPRDRGAGASRCPGTRSRRSTCGSTRCSTTRRRSPTRGRARTYRALLAGPLAAAGQGHPQVPRRHLAGDAAGAPATSCRGSC